MLDKKEAMERLDAIEAEAKKLREIIEAPEKVEPWRPKKPTLCWVGDNAMRGDKKLVSIVCDMHSGGPYLDNDNFPWDHAVPLTRAEALAMVDEPSRYPWDEAPEDAMWAATDSDGFRGWYAEKPDLRGRSWYGKCISKIDWDGEYCLDFAESLEPRP